MTTTITNNPKMESIIKSVQNSYSELQDLINGSFRKLPTSKLYQQPAPNEWSLMQCLAHVTEIMPYWGGQIEKLVAQPGQNFGRIMSDPDRTRYIEEHGHDTLDQIEKALPVSYAQLESVLQNLKDSDLELTGKHSKYGEQKLDWFMGEFVTNHLINHLKQLNECLAIVQNN